jgi:protein tyrosine phosphatase (PTP) superfamily phosphohydrolase (DUF442 family)
MTRRLILLVGILLGLATGGPGGLSAEPPEPPSREPPEAIERTPPPPSAARSQAVSVESAPHLPNLHRLPGDILSGGLPADEAAFRALQQLGVKTVISVDGAPPNLPLAKRYGMRYVHLPIGYDGVPSQRVLALAHAVATLPRPIYFHCHHGKHRSPAAAVVACIATGELDPDTAQATLEQMGTAAHYAGLYRAARRAEPLPAATRAGNAPALPESVPPPPMVEAMLDIERLRDRLADQLTSWERIAPVASPARNATAPDGARLALLLREQLVEMQRLQSSTFASAQQASAFRALLTQSIQHAADLETAWQEAGQTGKAASLRSVWQRVQDDCRSCHRRFRDPPQ